MQTYDYLIIGNSHAAVGCVEGIRSVDKTGTIAVMSGEKYHCYSRPLISYLFEGKTDLERIKYRPSDFYKKNGVTTMLSTKAEEINPDEKTVLAQGEKVGYRKLLVAVGSSPFVPPVKGYETVSKKFTFLELDSALALKKALTPKSRVLIVGAGLIGLKCAEGIYGKCGKITIVDLAPKVLSSVLDDGGAKIVREHIEKQGIEFHLGTSVAEFDKKRATLLDGTVIDFDILVMAVGVRANTALVAQAGGEVGRGIITDSRQKTSLADIYAAGDCTECDDISCGTRRVLAILPNAYSQGFTAGVCMAGGEAKFDKAIPMNSVGFFGLHLVTAGSYTGKCYSDTKDGKYKKLFYEDNLLKGYIIIGDVSRAGIYTSLIREQIPLDTVDFKLLCETPALAAFSREYRKEKLGGIVK